MSNFGKRILRNVVVTSPPFVMLAAWLEPPWYGMFGIGYVLSMLADAMWSNQ